MSNASHAPVNPSNSVLRPECQGDTLVILLCSGSSSALSAWPLVDNRQCPPLIVTTCGTSIFLLESDMPKRIISLRRRAAHKQGYRCYYCNSPMWEADLAVFAATTQLSMAQAAERRCTAEHLVPKSDGGRDIAANVVAACLFCNRTRHRARNSRAPSDYKRYVSSRIRLGRWLAGTFSLVEEPPFQDAS
jgi:hypothetical protein